jgi:nucleoside-diphosphate-sugar epimerase
VSGVIVTGAGGFLGRYVVAALLRRGYEVHGLGRHNAVTGFPAPVTWHSVDLMDRAQARDVLHLIGAEGLVHLAWHTKHGKYWNSPQNLDWVAASLGLFRDFRDCGGQRIVMAGSSAEYDWSSEAPFDELATPARPDSIYGRCKNSLREILDAWSSISGVSWAWGRIFNVFGPFEPSARLVPRVINTLRQGRDLPFDDGHLIRDFLHVSDAGEAFAALYASAFQGVANVASGVPVTVGDLVTEIARDLGESARVRFGTLPVPQGAPSKVVGSVARIRSATGWSPALDLREAVHDTCLWWRDSATLTGRR